MTASDLPKNTLAQIRRMTREQAVRAIMLALACSKADAENDYNHLVSRDFLSEEGWLKAEDDEMDRILRRGRYLTRDTPNA